MLRFRTTIIPIALLIVMMVFFFEWTPNFLSNYNIMILLEDTCVLLVGEVHMNESAVTHSASRTRIDGHTEIVKVLIKKREQLTVALQEHDASMTRLQEEYSARLNQMREEQRPIQQALEHVEALLQLEGWKEPYSPDTANTAESASPEPISYIDAVYKLLEDVGQPMHYKAIRDKLMEKGVYIPGRDAAATLLAKISRDSRFKRIRKRGTYALSFWRISAAKTRARTPRKKS